MPIYHYKCRDEECPIDGEIHQSIHEDALVTCPGCGQDSLYRVLYAPTVIDATPKTVGAVADRNSKPSYWLDSKRHEAANRKKLGLEELQKSAPAGWTPARVDSEADTGAWWRGPKINTDLNRMTPQQKTNYIMTGDSNG